MAIRKMRKKMKLPIAIFVTAFIATILFSIVGGINYWKASQRHALTLNGTKVDAIKIERSLEQGLNYYRNQYGADKIDADDAKLVLFSNLIEQELLRQAAKDLKVKVSNKEVEAEYEKYSAQYADKKTFSNALSVQGYNKGTFKAELKKGLLVTKAKEAIEATAKVEEAEMKAYYEANKYEAYLGKTYEESKAKIEERLLSLKKTQVYNSFIEGLKEKAKCEWREEAQYAQYQNYAESYEEGKGYTVSGYKYSNVDLAQRKMIQRLYGLSDEEALDKSVKESIDREVRIAVAAKEKGITVDENLAQTDEIYELTQGLRKKLISEAKITDKELKDYFDTNKESYNTKENADIKLIELEVKTTEADEKAALEKANKILAKAKEAGVNFAQLAMQYSDGPSAPNGGSLGSFKKGQMVPEFENAAFSGEVGIYPEVVKTKFGYHIIKIEGKTDNKVTASHILVTVKASDETMQATKAKAEGLIADINSKKTTFEDVAKEYSQLKESTVTGINKGGYISGVGYDEKLNADIFAAKANKLTVSLGEEKVFIFEQTKHVPFKEAKLEDLKDRVRYNLAKEKATAEMTKISNGTK